MKKINFFVAIVVVYGCTFSNAQDFWQQSPFPSDKAVQSFAINANGEVFAATFGAGVFRSTDSGDSWTQVNTGLTEGVVYSVVINSSGHLYAGTGNNNGIFRSTDNGDNWSHVLENVSVGWLEALALNSNDHVYAGIDLFNGVYRSTDNGASWSQAGLNSMSVVSLAISPADHIFVWTSGSGLYRSTDNGANWEWMNLTAVLNSSAVSPLAVNSEGHLFAGTWIDGIYRSMDNGDNWSQLNTGLSNTPVNALVINGEGHIYAGLFSGGGVIRSLDNGDTWQAINEGFPAFPSMDALGVGADGYVYAGTGGGVYRSIEPTITSVARNESLIPEKFVLEQNFPNPFNPSTQIFYSLSKATHVELVIYNVLGEKVRTLVNEFQTADQKSIVWNGLDASGASVTSGIYFIQSNAGSFRVTKKMTLLR